jgi:hypothetical protein
MGVTGKSSLECHGGVMVSVLQLKSVEAERGS